MDFSAGAPKSSKRQTKYQRRRIFGTGVCSIISGEVECGMGGAGSSEPKFNEQDAFQKIVMHAFNLPPAFRKTFLLCDIRGFTVEETAAVLRISPLAVTLRLNRARREINLRLTQGTAEPSAGRRSTLKKNERISSRLLPFLAALMLPAAKNERE
jgi:DNA-directed RNA polymerase specialized sigma24 family protein